MKYIKDMREFCSILIFKVSENWAADKFLVRIYINSWNRTYVLNKLPLTFYLNTKCTDHNFLFVTCPFINKTKNQTKTLVAVKSRALYALAIQPVTACCILCSWHHALLIRWGTGNTVRCLLKKYYYYPQRENTKKQKN